MDIKRLKNMRTDETKKKDTLFDFIFCPGKSYKKLMDDLKIKKKN